VRLQIKWEQKTKREKRRKKNQSIKNGADLGRKRTPLGISLEDQGMDVKHARTVLGPLHEDLYNLFDKACFRLLLEVLH
jgi:hypothetical protein